MKERKNYMNEKTYRSVNHITIKTEK